MSRIRSVNTSPERIVRSFLHYHGFRFRLHRKDLPGKPDIVLSRLKAVIFVHGCFWHQCPLCKGGRLPKSNLEYWKAKLEKNKARDLQHAEALGRLGWKVITLWECQASEEGLIKRVLKKIARLDQQAK